MGGIVALQLSSPRSMAPTSHLSAHQACRRLRAHRMRRWQHKVVIHRVFTGQLIGGSAEDSEREEMLDSYGRDGWELTSVILQGYRREGDPTLFYGYTFFHYYFKREIQESEEGTSEQELAVRGKKSSTTQPTEGTRDLEVSVARPSRGAIGGDRRFADAPHKTRNVM